MKGLNLINAEDLKNWSILEHRGNKWRLSRPVGDCSLLHRIKLAFKVFIGEYDALTWEDKKKSTTVVNKVISETLNRTQH